MKFTANKFYLLITLIAGIVLGFLADFFYTGGEGSLSHISRPEVVGVIFGIALVWVLRYSKDKDKADDKDESFSIGEWVKHWFLKKNDNVLAHVCFSFAALYIGVNNLQAWLGDQINFPEGVDQIGAAFIIGFIGSYAAEILKKAL